MFNMFNILSSFTILKNYDCDNSNNLPSFMFSLVIHW
jgi:hypothetical protein